MRRYFAARTDRCACLYFDKCSDHRFVANHAAIQIDELRLWDSHSLTEPNVSTDRHAGSPQLFLHHRVRRGRSVEGTNARHDRILEISRVAACRRVSNGCRITTNLAYQPSSPVSAAAQSPQPERERLK